MDYTALKDQNKALSFEETRAGSLHLKSRPLYFWFDISGSCNLRCTHCGYNTMGRTSEEEVTSEVYEKVLADIMPTAYVCNLGGTNWGEMTIAKKFHPFLQDCKKYGVKVNLTTNGTKMAPEWFDDLLDVLTVIGFSMEGMEEEFEKIRGFKWKHFLKNVEKVCEGRAHKKKAFRVEWRYCAHSDSIKQLPAMIRTARSVGIDRIQVMNLVPYVAEQKFKNLYYHRSLANACFQEARKVAAELSFDVQIPPAFETGTFTRSELIQIGKTGTPKPAMPGIKMVSCYRPWQACSINELGNVKPCCIYWRSMGNLSKSSFEQVWNGRKYRRLRKSVNTKSDSICYSCRMPKFDSDENTSAFQLVPGVRELLKRTTDSMFHSPAVKYVGVMDKQFAP